MDVLGELCPDSALALEITGPAAMLVPLCLLLVPGVLLDLLLVFLPNLSATRLSP